MSEVPTAVAVVVPVRNGGETIGTCIQALLALDWPRQALEVVIVDNGSTDDTRDVIARYPVRRVEETSRPSSYAARNRGVAATTAPIVAFTDADCVPTAGWVRGLVRALSAADVCGVAGPIEAWRSDTLLERWQGRRALRAERAFRHPVLPFAQTANAAYRRDDLVAVGGFDADVVFGGDLDLSWRLQRRTGRRLAWAADALVRHRHRTTWQGLFRLYEKNAIANCLLAERWSHYAHYPQWRTGAWLARELGRSAVRGALHRPRDDGDPSAAHWADAVRFAGELSGWARWRGGWLPAGARRCAARSRWEEARA